VVKNKFKQMKNLIKILSIITFILSSATVISIFYEGMILKWLSFVEILILSTDILFLLSTIFGTIYYRKNKTLFYSHLFSILIIIMSIIIILIYNKNVPKLLFTIYEFYIFYFYFITIIKKWWKNL
jgi:hypothetical protein